MLKTTFLIKKMTFSKHFSLDFVLTVQNNKNECLTIKNLRL